MPRLDKETITENIRTAVVVLARTKGIAALSMADVAKEARVSAGTLYLHFNSKDDMVQRTYMHIKLAFHADLMDAAASATGAAQMRAMWDSLIQFARAKPAHLLFIDNLGAAQMLTEAQSKDVAALQSDIARVLQTAIDRGTLASLPIPTLSTLLIAPAMHIARLSATDKRAISDDEIALTFDRVWLSIAPSTPS